MSKTIIKAPSITMNKLEDLFIEMTPQNYSLKSCHSFKDFGSKKAKDFIPAEKIKKALEDISKEDLQLIHLTGAEPMLHNDFNQILRLCLKYASCAVHTNALNINDKKARFLRKVEEENQFGREIIFIISMYHYDEKTNDELSSRGSFRKAVHAVQSLVKYDFNPIISIVNHMNEDEKELKENFRALFSTINFEVSDFNLKIIPWIDKNKKSEMPADIDLRKIKTECSKGRTLTANGVFSCPLLADDNRGRCGNDFKDYTKISYLETPCCIQCAESKKPLFCLDL